MAENFTGDTEVHAQEVLNSVRARLLASSISRMDACAELTQLDQSDPARSAAPHILAFLKEPEVSRYFLEGSGDEINTYHSFFSFIAFHVAQIQALQDKYDEAITYCNESIEATKKTKPEADDVELAQANAEWIAYVQGTILYLQSKEIPDEIVNAAGRNKNVLLNLNAGFRKRGHPDYKVDYSNAPLSS